MKKNNGVANLLRQYRPLPFAVVLCLSSAAVLAQAGGIASYEVGAWNIPGDGLAFLHSGEMVVPKPFASDLRDNGGLGGGGDVYSININAIDTQTGAQFLKNNASVIAQTISGQMRNLNSKLRAS